MQLSPLQSRLAASLAASLLLLALYVLLFSPHVALAAELHLDSHLDLEPLAAELRLDSQQEALETADEQQQQQLAHVLHSASYEAEFQLLGRAMVGRAPPGVERLDYQEPRARNLQPGATACYVVQKGGGSPGTLFLSANTCLQPRSSAPGGSKSSPGQMMLTVSNSSETACQRRAEEPKAEEGKAFSEGAVMYSLRATGDVFVGITAPNVSSDLKGLYNFEVAASLDGFFHRYENGSVAELLWMDSDSTSALLVTRNLTEKPADVGRVMSQEPPYELFVSNNASSTMDGLRHSVCGLQNTAQITANSESNGRLNSPVKTAMTLRGPGNLPKQQFHLVALNASSSYTGILVKRSKSRQKRQAEADSGGGSVVFRATDFKTVSGTSCKVVTDLEFCNETQYAVPGNDNKFNSTALAQAYDDYAKSMYSNFEKVMMQIRCEAPRTSLYSLARNCDDCRAAYKRWLCTVSMPRCEDFDSSNGNGLVRNAGQAFPNGTELAAEVREGLGQQPYSMASRNTFIDEEIQPGPYKEILPCEDVCYEVVQSCPAKIGFSCPQPDTRSFGFSYGRRGRNGSAVACNYPGEARTPATSAGRQGVVLPKPMLLLLLLGGGLSVAAWMVG